MKHAALLGLAALAVACSIGGSSPASEFYVLYPQTSRQTATGPALCIELRRPGLPAYLERPEIVRRVEGGQLALAATERWGGSLTSMLATTLAEDLARALPRSQVYTESGAISANPDVWVEVELEHFEQGPNGSVQTSALVAVHPRRGPATLRRVEIERAPTSDSTEAMVAALSGSLSELATAIADILAANASASAGFTGTAGCSASEG